MDVVTIDGKVALETALSHLAAAIEESDARVTHDTLPPISADETQLVHRGIDPQIMSIDPRSGKSGLTAVWLEAVSLLPAQILPSMFRARAGERKAAIRKLVGLNERQQC